MITVLIKVIMMAVMMMTMIMSMLMVRMMTMVMMRMMGMVNGDDENGRDDPVYAKVEIHQSTVPSSQQMAFTQSPSSSKDLQILTIYLI